MLRVPFDHVEHKLMGSRICYFLHITAQKFYKIRKLLIKIFKTPFIVDIFLLLVDSDNL